jgi:hypothetical protein
MATKEPDFGWLMVSFLKHKQITNSTAPLKSKHKSKKKFNHYILLETKGHLQMKAG